MTPRHDALRRALYTLFALSGFAGLIYESIWSHYLKLFLGHAAYAQTLVLVIFMGGMAGGAYLAGEWSRRLRWPFLAYIAAEGLLGIAALVFDPLFRGMQAWMFDSVIPSIDSPLAIDLLKWSISALIILPQSMLLGTTFPLMSAGLVRLFPLIPGSALAWLYFTNSLGASIGVLFSGFILIDKVGLPGTIMTAGLINFALAISVWALVKRYGVDAQAPAQAAATTAAERSRAGTSLILLATAFGTGAASFIYEIGWIRMLCLVLGSATHSFELMLSAFILGLALGAFYIRSRIDGEAEPLRKLGWIQLIMGLLALCSLPLYLQTFGAMSWFLESVEPNQGGYLLFNLFAHVICLLLMLPVTFMAGMTLPLMTAALIRTGQGESSIGRIYAANTVGAIAGVIVAVHVLMPLLGLRQVVVAGAVVDMGLGFWLLASAARGGAPVRRWAAAAGLLAAAAIVALVPLDPRVTGSGVFRRATPRLSAELVFHRDGKTATVNVTRRPDGNLAISTNGKVDAGLHPAKPGSAPDDSTMVLAGVIPVLLHPEAREVAVIGMGSGRSTHSLLSYSALNNVDTVEIEPAMIAGARMFKGANDRAYDDPRSHLHVEDAKTFFARNRKRYDIIVSEPSNPWVSGVSSLFSTEFYHQVKRYLNDGGLFVQWLQLYEIDVPLVASVVKALGSEFEDYAAFVTNDSDVLFIATPRGRMPRLSETALQDPGFAALAAQLDVRHTSDVRIRMLGTKATLAPYFATGGYPPNSDYFPVLDQNAVKRRYLQSSAAEPLLSLHSVLWRVDDDVAGEWAPLAPKRYFYGGETALEAADLEAYWQGRESAQMLARLPAPIRERITLVRALDRSCAGPAWEEQWLTLLEMVASKYVPYLRPAGAQAITAAMRASPCAAQATPELRDLAELVEAATSRRWPQVRDTGGRMIARTVQAGRPLQAYLLRETFLADYMVGGAAALPARVAQLSGPMPNSPAVNYFLTLARARGVPTRTVTPGGNP
ncbi:MAG TPA: hypothetical protein VM074_00915 [Solimonas sp.]|nr:hypothetical protein [Solimonas sp.]